MILLLSLTRRLRLFVESSVLALLAVFWWHRSYPSSVSELAWNITLPTFIAALVAVIYDWSKSALNLNLVLLEASDLRIRRGRIISFDKSNAAQGRFFRVPSAWVDFHQRYVVIREEVDELVAHIGRNRSGVILIEGDPASGKSVLVRSVEYSLNAIRGTGRRRGIFSLQLKALYLDPLRIRDLYDDIGRLPNGSIVIIDDVHLHMHVFTDLASKLVNKSILLVYVSRPLRNLVSRQASDLEEVVIVRRQIFASEIADSIVDRYLEVEHKFPVPVRKSCQVVFDPYKQDLWVLGVALQASSRMSNTVALSEERISEWIIKNLLSAIAVQDHVVSRGLVLAPIAALYQFEVPADTGFVKRYSGLGDFDIQLLFRTGDVQRYSDNSLALYHSSLAGLVLRALKRNSALVPVEFYRAASSMNLPLSDWSRAAIALHIEEVPFRAIADLAGLARSTSHGQGIARNLICRVSERALVTAIDPEVTTVEDLGSVFHLFILEGLAVPLEALGKLEYFVHNAPKNSVQSWAWATQNVARVSALHANLFIGPLQDMLANESVRVVADVGNMLSYASEVLAQKVLEELSPSDLLLSLRREETRVYEMAMIVAKLVWVRPKWVEAFFGIFDTMVSGLSAADFEIVISRIAWGNASAARELMASVAPERLFGLISAAASDEERCSVLASIFNIAPDRAILVARLADVAKLSGGLLWRVLNKILGQSPEGSGWSLCPSMPAELMANLSTVLTTSPVLGLGEGLLVIERTYGAALCLIALMSVHLDISEAGRTEVLRWTLSLSKSGHINSKIVKSFASSLSASNEGGVS